MEDETSITMTNIAMFIITGLLIVILIIVGLLLNRAKTVNNYDSLPELEVIEDKTTSKKSRTSLTVTRSTEVIESPYYTINVDELFEDELIKKASHPVNTYQEVVRILVTYANQIMYVNDYSLLDTARVVKYAKEDEVDKIVTKGNDYAIIYNSKELLSKIFTEEFIKNMIYYKYEDKAIFVTYRDNYYRLVTSKIPEIKIRQVGVSYTTTKKLMGTVNYGAGIGSVKIELLYEEDRWKINSYEFPKYTFEIPKEEPTTPTSSTTTEEVTKDANI